MRHEVLELLFQAGYTTADPALAAWHEWRSDMSCWHQ
jgi:hypothetical protein